MTKKYRKVLDRLLIHAEGNEEIAENLIKTRNFLLYRADSYLSSFSRLIRAQSKNLK